MAFPVMTLVLGTTPSVARDVTFGLQSCGMTCASFTIWFMGVELEWHALGYCSISGVAGVILGLEVIAPLVEPPVKKMLFVTIWFAFAFALFLLNIKRTRTTFKAIPDFKPWKAVALCIAGLIGGIFSAFAGSGMDICAFSALTILFRISEKIATPTSVILMASNSLIGLYWRGMMSNPGIAMDSWEYVAVSAMIIVCGAPLGAMLGSHLHRQVLACCIYFLNTASLITAFIVIPMNPFLIGLSVGVIIFGFIFFIILFRIGYWILGKLDIDEVEKSMTRRVSMFVIDQMEVLAEEDETEEGEVNEAFQDDNNKPISSC